MRALRLPQSQGELFLLKVGLRGSSEKTEGWLKKEGAGKGDYSLGTIPSRKGLGGKEGLLGKEVQQETRE
jgi:hypothetical protein